MTLLSRFGATIIAALILTSLSVQQASAQQATALSVSPVTFELTANPGDVLTNQVKVTNLTESPLQLDTRVENISGASEQGQVQLTEEETEFSLSKWVTITPPTFSLGTKQSQTLTFTIKVPTNAEPGGHYGTLLVGTTASESLSQTGARIAQRIGSLLLVRVNGKSKEQAAVSRLDARSFSGEIDELTASDGKTKILIPKNSSMVGQKAQRYFSSGPVAIDFAVHNSGNVHVRPVGSVFIRNVFGRKVAELPIDSRNVFPGSDRRMTAIWPQKQLWGVYYHAQLVGYYGSNQNQTLTADATFWGFPLPVAIGAGVALLLLLLLRKRLGRAFRILIKGA